MDDPASTSLHRLDFVAGEYLSAGPTPRRQGAIDSTARGPTATATSCRVSLFFFLQGNADFLTLVAVDCTYSVQLVGMEMYKMNLLSFLS